MKKYLSVILAITLTFSVMPIASQAVEITASSMQEVISKNAYAPKQKNQTESSSKIKCAFMFLATGLAVALSGLIGYKIGNDRGVADEHDRCVAENDRRLADEKLGDAKEITIIATESDDVPPPGEVFHEKDFCDVQSTINYIDRLLDRDIPKLSKEKTFSKAYIHKLYLEVEKMHSMSTIEYKGDARDYACFPIDKKLNDLPYILKPYDRDDVKIPLGYLKKLLNDTKSILNEVLPHQDKCRIYHS